MFVRKPVPQNITDGLGSPARLSLRKPETTVDAASLRDRSALVGKTTRRILRQCSARKE